MSLEEDPILGRFFDTPEKKAKWITFIKIGYILWILFMILGLISILLYYIFW